jgi:glucan phosphorylase
MLRVEMHDSENDSTTRLWEASGTSGIKALVNGGLNLSGLDGWCGRSRRHPSAS